MKAQHQETDYLEYSKNIYALEDLDRKIKVILANSEINQKQACILRSLTEEQIDSIGTKILNTCNLQTIYQKELLSLNIQ